MSSMLLSNRLGISQQVRELSENSAIALVSFSWESKLENTVQPTKERANVCPCSWVLLGGEGDSLKCHPMPTHTALHTHVVGDAVK